MSIQSPASVLWGGDAHAEEVCRLAYYIRMNWGGEWLKTAWYSGNSNLHPMAAGRFDYVKTGPPYLEALGGLSKKNDQSEVVSNQ